MLKAWCVPCIVALMPTRTRNTCKAAVKSPLLTFQHLFFFAGRRPTNGVKALVEMQNKCKYPVQKSCIYSSLIKHKIRKSCKPFFLRSTYRTLKMLSFQAEYNFH